jgi:hypothetical protein
MKLLECHSTTAWDNDRWVGSDSKESYQKNLKIQPADWYWRNHNIRYTTNSQRYRAPEWDKIDWDNSIVVFGCSEVFGIGVDDEQTVCYQLGRILKVNVVNLGMPGGSCMGLWINTEKLLNYNINPLAVIYNWPTANRVVELIDDTKNIAAGIWMLNQPPRQFGKEWVMHPTQGFEYAKHALMSVRRSWSCPQIHHSWDIDLANFLKLPRHLKVDEARDCMHYGPVSNFMLATRWAKELTTKLKI